MQKELPVIVFLLFLLVSPFVISIAMGGFKDTSYKPVCKSFYANSQDEQFARDVAIHLDTYANYVHSHHKPLKVSLSHILNNHSWEKIYLLYPYSIAQQKTSKHNGNVWKIGRVVSYTMTGLRV